MRTMTVRIHPETKRILKIVSAFNGESMADTVERLVKAEAKHIRYHLPREENADPEA